MRRRLGPLLATFAAIATLAVVAPPPAGATIPPWVADASGTLIAGVGCAMRPNPLTVQPGQSARFTSTSGHTIANSSTIDMRASERQMVPGTLVTLNPPDAPDPDYLPPGGRPWYWTDGLRWPVQLATATGQARSDVCILGGRVWSAIPDRHVADNPLTTLSNETHWDEYGWDLLWHKSTAVQVYTASPTIVAMEIEQQGDGIDMQGTGASNWRIRGVRMTEVHDDCIEADEHTSGIVDDSLLDGCFSAIVSRAAAVSAPGNTVTVSNSLIRMQPMNAGYKPLKHGYPGGGSTFVPFHGGVFKWDADGPRLVLDNTVIMSGDAIFGSGVDVPLPPNTTCTDATLIWTAGTPISSLSTAVRTCFDDDGVAPLGERITTDTIVWDDAVAAWEAAR